MSVVRPLGNRDFGHAIFSLPHQLGRPNQFCTHILTVFLGAYMCKECQHCAEHSVCLFKLPCKMNYGFVGNMFFGWFLLVLHACLNFEPRIPSYADANCWANDLLSHLLRNPWFGS
jgi:hypothetical protein